MKKLILFQNRKRVGILRGRATAKKIFALIQFVPGFKTVNGMRGRATYHHEESILCLLLGVSKP